MTFLIILIIFLPLAYLVANEGKKKKIGFGFAFAISIVFSPLIGYIVVAASSDNQGKIPPHKIKRLLGEGAEEKEEYENALKYYRESLHHLENDYKSMSLSSQAEEKRKTSLEEIKKRIERLKPNSTM